MDNLNGQIILVTEAADGWGPAIASCLLANGATVVSLGHTDGRIRDVMHLECDLQEENSVATRVTDIAERFTRVDALVHSAGAISLTVSFASSDDAEARRYVGSAASTTRAVVPQLIAQEQGSVVLFSSALAFGSLPGHASKSIAAGQIRELTESLARTVGPHGVRVNAIAPGYIEEVSSMTGTTSQFEPPRVPLGRQGLVSELASVTGFLVSANSSYITGQTLAVDGGWITQTRDP